MDWTSNLPAEILRDIFELVEFAPTDKVDSYRERLRNGVILRRALRAAVFVCIRWHKTISSNPLFYFISLGYYHKSSFQEIFPGYQLSSFPLALSKLEEALNAPRFSKSLLNININWEPEDGEYYREGENEMALASKIASHIHRLDHIAIHHSRAFSVSNFMERCSQLGISTFPVKTLEFTSAPYDWSLRVNAEYKPSFPRLEHLIIQGLGEPWRYLSGGVIPNLTCAHLNFNILSDIFPMLVEFITTCHSLRVLHLSSEVGEWTHTPLPPATRTSLSLNALSLTSGRLSLIHALMSQVQFPSLVSLTIGGPRHHIPVAQSIPHWAKAMDFPSLKSITLRHCHPLLPLLLFSNANLRTVRQLVLQDIWVTEEYRLEQERFDMPEIHILQCSDIEPSFLFSLLNRLTMDAMVNLIINYSCRPHGPGDELAHPEGSCQPLNLSSLLKMQLSIPVDILERLLTLLPNELPKLGMFVFAVSPGVGRQNLLSTPTRTLIGLPKLQKLALPDLGPLSQSLLLWFSIPQRPLHSIIMVPHPKYRYDPREWDSLVKAHGALLSWGINLEVTVPTEAYNFALSQKADFPLLATFPRVLLLILHLENAKPEALGYILQKGKDPRGRPYRDGGVGGSLIRLDLRIDAPSRWFTVIYRVITAYQSRNIPLPKMVISSKEAFSADQQEWLESVPNVKLHVK